MKAALKISIVLNLGLLGWLMAFRAHQVKPAVETEHPPALLTCSALPITVSPVSNPPPAKSEPFHWHQLYAEDYHVYVKNLRAIGCPESALRAIVKADVRAVLQPEALSLEKKLADLANRPWEDQIGSRTNAEAWKAELLRLPDEEAAMVAEYLGEHPLAASPDPLTAQTAVANTNEAPEPVAIPLVAQPVDLAALNLNDDQMQALDDLKKLFLQKIGGPDQDPNDSAYQARWRTAQAEVDNLMQGMIGTQAYEEYQTLVLASSQAQSSKNFPSAP